MRVYYDRDADINLIKSKTVATMMSVQIVRRAIQIRSEITTVV